MSSAGDLELRELRPGSRPPARSACSPGRTSHWEAGRVWRHPVSGLACRHSVGDLDGNVGGLLIGEDADVGGLLIGKGSWTTVGSELRGVDGLDGATELPISGPCWSASSGAEACGCCEVEDDSSEAVNDGRRSPAGQPTCICSCGPLIGDRSWATAGSEL